MKRSKEQLLTAKEGHDLFDPLWQSGKMTRKEVYRMVARHLGLRGNAMHFSLLTRNQLDKAKQLLGGIQ